MKLFVGLITCESQKEIIKVVKVIDLFCNDTMDLIPVNVEESLPVPQSLADI